VLDGSPQSALWWISSLRENYAMVFDNADNLTPEELEQYFPSGLGGNILITSCNSGLKHLTSHESSLEVREMGEHDATSLPLKKGHLNITELCMGLGNYHLKKFCKELKVMILKELRQLRVQYFFWHCLLSFILIKLLKKYFLMLLLKSMRNMEIMSRGLLCLWQAP
jgi:hypothetical protein